MIHVLVGCTVKPELLEQALAVYRELIAETRKEPGCVSYELLELRDDPGQLMLSERWLSQEHLNAHTQTVHFIRAMAELEILETAAPALIYTQVL